jgi:S-adenosylmethionine hydrolase
MRRSICYCEPSYALAGDVKSWKFIYTTSVALPKGTLVKFDLLTKGRQIDWQLPDTSLSSPNAIYAAMDGHKQPIAAEAIEMPGSVAPQFEFVLPAKLDAGKNLTIVLGGSKGKDAGNMAQTYVQRRRPFNLYIDTTGKGHFGEPEVFSLDIRGHELKTIRILAPSFVVKNKRFDVIVRFEDEFGNLTSNAPEDTLIELSYENIRENLNWKLFVPETGFISLPNLYFNEPGVYTLQLKNMRTKEVYRSAPIKCFADNQHNLFWGILHGESDRIDSTENIESCLRHFRDDKAINFFAASPFESIEETPNEVWKLISQNVTDFNEEDRFSTFLGFQWQGESSSEGLRHFIYTKDHKPILRKKDVKNNALNKIYRSLSPKEAISIPSFTMGQGLSYDFKDFNPDFERVVEIYNAWGSSECTAKDGNTFPIVPEGKRKGIKESAEGAVQRALQNNCRFGFVAGGLDDRGVYADFFDSDQTQYHPGLTAIISEHHTREALMEALYNRSCYATTGERIIVGLSLAGANMGSQISTEAKPGLTLNRHLAGYVAGTKALKSIEIIRNGKVIETLTTKDYFLEFTYDDMTPLEDVVLPAANGKLPFVYYYIRVTQEDGHMAWSSPIWVDFAPKKKDARKPVKV